MNKWRLLLSKIFRFFIPIDNVTIFKRMGVKIGSDCKIMNEVIIDYSHYWLVSIGNNVTLAPRVHIIAHDASAKNNINYTKIGLIDIQDNVFIGAGSIIMPGVTIGKNVIVGAGSIVVKDIPPNSVAVGSPARVVKSFDDFIVMQKNLLRSDNCFDESYTTRGNITEKKKQEMVAIIKKYGYAFVE